MWESVGCVLGTEPNEHQNPRFQGKYSYHTHHSENPERPNSPYVSVLLSVWDASRKALIYFRRPPERDSFYGDKDFPDLAVRDGKWKFLPIFPFKGEDKTGWIARWTFSLAGFFMNSFLESHGVFLHP